MPALTIAELIQRAQALREEAMRLRAQAQATAAAAAILEETADELLEEAQKKQGALSEPEAPED